MFILDTPPKELNSSVSKLCKLIDKAIPPLDQTLPNLHLDASAVLRAVHLHLLITGRLESAAKLREEAQLDLGGKGGKLETDGECAIDNAGAAGGAAAPGNAATLEALEAQYRIVHEVLGGLSAEDLTRANAWVEENYEWLRAQCSSLPFLLTRIGFTQRLRSEGASGALTFVRERMVPAASLACAPHPESRREEGAPHTKDASAATKLWSSVDSRGSARADAAHAERRAIAAARFVTGGSSRLLLGGGVRS